jgi:dCMP deaminase
MNRPTKEEILMKTALLYAERSTCIRIKAGAVISLGGHIISVGYNGNTPGKEHCIEHFEKEYEDLKKMGVVLASTWEQFLQSDWLLKNRHHEWALKYELHAEMNAIIWAARRGIAVEGADIYTTYSPCLFCTKAILQSGIKRVYYNQLYDKPEGQKSLEVLEENGIFVQQIKI